MLMCVRKNESICVSVSRCACIAAGAAPVQGKAAKKAGNLLSLACSACLTK